MEDEDNEHPFSYCQRAAVGNGTVPEQHSLSTVSGSGNGYCNGDLGLQHMYGESSWSVPFGSYSGSFSELLMSASSGLLGLHAQATESSVLEDHICSNIGDFPKMHQVPVEEQFHNAESLEGRMCKGNNIETDTHTAGYESPDEGYLGGHEWFQESRTDVISDYENQSGGSDHGCNDTEIFLGNEKYRSGAEKTLFDNSKDGFLDFETDNEEEDSHELLGGCASMSADEISVSSESDNDSQVSSEISGSEDDSDEKDISIEVDLAQEVYIDNMQINGSYKKRKRSPKNDNRPNYRKPRSMGTIERAMRASASRKTEHIFEPYIGLVFDSKEEAKEFYNLYSWEVGFGVKFCNSRTSGSKKDVEPVEQQQKKEAYQSMQEIVCQNAGTDAQTKNATRRCNCPAKIRLLRTDDYGWYVSFIQKEHNHPLSETCGEKREWYSHRQLDPYTKDMIKYLRENNVSLTKVHCIMGSMFGRMDDVPWTKRSLRTVCNQITRDNMEDDIKKTMEIFRQMREADPRFKFSVELDKQSRIKTLLWCSGRGQDQYTCFGDVVTFDTTYCTNIYKMPGLFVGVNNHFQTTIFGGVLMRRETAKSFKWVFSEFLKLMGGKAPQTILTDQCKAMTKAIRLVMPGTYHLWCKWHVMKRIRECLGPIYTKDKNFRDAFWLAVNGMLTEDEFEAGWKDLIMKYKLQHNSFMKRTYKCKKKWAKPWSRDKFCARMSSTQRSECANFMLKRFVPRNSSMNHFVSQYNRLLLDRDREEEVAEHCTKQLRMVHSRLWSIERHALTIYTKAAFELFRSEVDKASNYVLSEVDGDTYTISHDNASNREKWSRVHFKVQVLDEGKRYLCECGLYEHFGILCCHSIRLMLKMDVSMIPEAHIMKRWTRDARDILPGSLKVYQKDNPSLNSMTFRHRLSVKQAMELVDKGDMDMEMFDILQKHMHAAKKELDAKLADRRDKEEAGVQTEDSSEDETIMIPFQSDGEALCGNKYGTSGSSAHLSDTAMKFRAPGVKKKKGRRRTNRFMAGWEKKEGKEKEQKEEIQGCA